MIHGAGDVGWYWHLVEAELRARGHHAVAPDLPADDDSLGLDEYAETVIDAIADRRNLVVVGQSFGAFTAPLVADRLQADALVLVAGMIPAPGEPPGDWWENTGYSDAVRQQAACDGGLTGNEDPYVGFYHDVPRSLAEEAISRERSHPSAASQSALLASGRLAGCANEVRAVHRGPFLPACLDEAAGRRAAAHHAG